MFSSLRGRLLMSYLVVIGVMLCSVGAALFLLLLNNPLPTQDAYRRLETVARTSAPFVRPDDLDRLDQRLRFIAEANDIRIIRLGGDGHVIFDSAGQLTGDQAPNLIAPPRRGNDPNPNRGIYRDPEGRTWLYIAFGDPQQRSEVGQVLFITPRPRPAVGGLLGENVSRPLLQAGLIGLIVAVMLAAGVANWIARPLKHVAGTAHALAEGDLEQRAPLAGPREARELAQTFNHMAAHMQQAQQTQRDFLANVSHELKTPLTSIQGYSQAILDGTASDPARAAGVIHDEAGRMRRLVEDLLDLARIESGQTPFRRQHVDLDSLLEAVSSNLALKAAEKHIALEPDIADLPPITGDGDRLAQVFTNLIDNALTHTPSGGSVTVAATAADEGIRVMIQDTGPGIPADDLNRIFERFYQVDKSRVRRERTGTGLGLTISREIIEAHGGHITVDNAPQGGAVFTVWLPRPRPSDTTVIRRSQLQDEQPGPLS